MPVDARTWMLTLADRILDVLIIGAPLAVIICFIAWLSGKRGWWQ